METKIERMRKELDALNRRKMQNDPEGVTQDDRLIDPPPTAQERREHQQYTAEGGLMGLADWTTVQRAFRAYLGR